MDAPGPVKPLEAAKRNTALDALRGVAILGLVLVNVRHFAFPFAGELYPPLRTVYAGLDGTVFRLVSLLAEFKFLSILAVLFGAGLALREQRWDGAESFEKFYRRWLLGLGALGLLHGFFLWFGDILFLYSLAGLGALRFRKLSPDKMPGLCAALIFFGGAAAALGILVQGPGGRHVQALSYLLQEQTRIFSGGTWAQVAGLNAKMFAGVTALTLFSLGPRVLGLFLFGVWLVRSGLLERLERGSAWLHGAAALALGLALERAAAGSPSLTLQWLGHYFGSLAVAAGYFLILLRLFAAAGRLAAPLVSVGRTALSNYLLQSAVCAAVFFPYGAGLFKNLPLTVCVAMSLALIAAQTALSWAWTTWFRWGPLEFLLRGFSYGKFPPFAREGGPARAGLPSWTPRPPPG